MTAIKKTKEIVYDANLVANKTHIYISRKGTADQIRIDWKNKEAIHWSKYQIKETDMRVKTATFTSPSYFDLTTGQYIVLITSPLHEDFAGVLLKVEYDDSTDLYSYQCQDFSRMYQSKHSTHIANVTLYRVLSNFITRGNIPLGGKLKKSDLKKWKNVLSGLKPRYYYDQKAFGNKKNFNPMTQKLNMVFEGKSWIECIRSLVFSCGGYIDVFFDKYGTVQIKPYHKDDLYKNGLHLVASEITSQKPTFDITNMITGVIVQAEDKSKVGTYYGTNSLLNLDLRAFFGSMTDSITNPNQTKAKVTTKKATTSTSKSGNGTPVFMNTDNINSKSSDKKLMNDIAKLLRKKGYKVTVGGIGPGTHYNDINKVKKNGIYFTLYGGRCAGTLKEQATSSHYWNVLKKKNAKMVVGFYKRKLTDAYLPRAWDDNFSPRSFKGIKKPRSMLLNKGIGIAQGNSAKEIASSFPGFKK